MLGTARNPFFFLSCLLVVGGGVCGGWTGGSGPLMIWPLCEGNESRSPHRGHFPAALPPVFLSISSTTRLQWSSNRVPFDPSIRPEDQEDIIVAPVKSASSKHVLSPRARELGAPTVARTSWEGPKFMSLHGKMCRWAEAVDLISVEDQTDTLEDRKTHETERG